MKDEMKITGGFEGYKAAVKEGFSVFIHNQTIRYSPRRGFHVESGLTPRDEDAVDVGLCYYDLNNGDSRSFGTSYRDYLYVKDNIIEKLYGYDKRIEFENCHSDVFNYAVTMEILNKDNCLFYTAEFESVRSAKKYAHDNYGGSNGGFKRRIIYNPDYYEDTKLK